MSNLKGRYSKMKVLWITNMPLPDIAERIGVNTVLGGWLIALSERLRENPEIEFIYCFPQNRTSVLIYKQMRHITYYGFSTNFKADEYDNRLEKIFYKIYEKEEPDVIHIFGTEYAHTLAAIQSGIDLKKTVISIQGLVSVIAQHYCVGIPFFEQNYPCFDRKNGFRTIYKEKTGFIIRGKREKMAIKRAINFEGRTDFDRANICILNPTARYFKCNRILRQEFYRHKWELQKCDKNTIFLSQASYPVKGLHVFLEALYMLKKIGIEAKVNIGGPNILASTYDSSDPYARYIKKIVKKYDLTKNLVFLGCLNEQSMCRQYLKAHVFVSPSIIENSPNSLGEAMLLGVPSIASDVGGVSSVLEHGVDGFMYRADAPYLLAYYLYQIMIDDELAIKISRNGRKKAEELYDVEKNINSVMEMYNIIIENS